MTHLFSHGLRLNSLSSQGFELNMSCKLNFVVPLGAGTRLLHVYAIKRGGTLLLEEIHIL